MKNWRFYFYKGKVIELRQAERDHNGYYKVNDVIDWFLSRGPMSPKKLQKLLYYAYAWDLTLGNESPDNLSNRLFKDEFEAWVHGPVIPSVYNRFRDLRFNDISQQRDTHILFDEDTQDVLEQVWREYGEYNGNQLESISHQEDPWRIARGDSSPLERCNTVINDEDIFNYYIRNVAYED